MRLVLAVGLGHRRVQHRACGLRDIRAGAIALDVENNRPVRHRKSPGGGCGHHFTLFMVMLCHDFPRFKY